MTIIIFFYNGARKFMMILSDNLDWKDRKYVAHHDMGMTHRGLQIVN